MKKWKKRYIVPAIVSAMAICALGITQFYPQPVLLENDELPSNSNELILPDGNVPMSNTPFSTSADPYENLSNAQINQVNQVLDLVNEARSNAGIHALTLDPSLQKAAQVRAEECVSTFSHTRPNGTSYKTALTEAGVTSGYTGENVASGHTSAEQVVNSWLQSSGHRANILNPNYNSIGIGVEEKSRGYAWTQEFAN